MVKVKAQRGTRFSAVNSLPPPPPYMFATCLLVFRSTVPLRTK